jgi:hypothetical protein
VEGLFTIVPNHFPKREENAPPTFYEENTQRLKGGQSIFSLTFLLEDGE